MKLGNYLKDYDGKEEPTFRRGDVYYVRQEGNSQGSVQTGNRPGIIVSNDVGNEHSPTVIVVYTTTQPKRDLPTHVTVNSLAQKSTVLCEQIVTVSKSQLVEYACHVTDKEMSRIDKALAISVNLTGEREIIGTEFKCESSLLTKARNHIDEIIRVAKKINQIDKTLLAVQNSSTFSFANGGLADLEDVLSAEKVKTLQNFFIKQIEDEKLMEERVLERLLVEVETEVSQEVGADTKQQKPAYLTAALKDKIAELYLGGAEEESIAVETNVDMARLTRYIAKSGLSGERRKKEKHQQANQR